VDPHGVLSRFLTLGDLNRPLAALPPPRAPSEEMIDRSSLLSRRLAKRARDSHRTTTGETRHPAGHPLLPRGSRKGNGDGSGSRCSVARNRAKPRKLNVNADSATSLDSRTATEPAISSRLCCPHLAIPRSPLYGYTRAATHSVPRCTTNGRMRRRSATTTSEAGGGNRPEPDAHLQVQEALTRGSSVREPGPSLSLSLSLSQFSVQPTAEALPDEIAAPLRINARSVEKAVGQRNKWA
jgi:hypothetical protein